MTSPHLVLNELPEEAAAQALHRCCGSQRWVTRMLALRPFSSNEALQAAADSTWFGLSEEDHLEAFAHHPQIGDDAQTLARRFEATAALSSREQSAVREASEQTRSALDDANRVYAARFGFVFLVCATGKSADEMLALLRQRLQHDRRTELGVAATEQAKITRLRLMGLQS